MKESESNMYLKVGICCDLNPFQDVGEPVFTRFQPFIVKRLYAERIALYHWISEMYFSSV